MSRWAVLLVIIALPWPTAGRAATLDQLVADGRLSIARRIESEAPLLQRAPIILAVEVATPRWFQRGTRVQDFHIPGAIVRPVSTFADNQTRRVGGETWSVQRWRFRIFAERAGRLEIPPLRVFASVNTEEFGAVEGEFTLAGTDLLIEAPDGAPDTGRWIAARTLRAEQRWEGEADAYLPGDALTRIRRFTIVDAPAMVIEGSEVTPIDGIELYAAPPTVADRQDRGALSGVREERAIFTLQTAGTYSIPGYEATWYNIETGTFETLTLPAKTITVLSDASPAQDPGENFEFGPAPRLLAIALGLMLVLGALGYTALPRLRESAAGRGIAEHMRRARRRRDYFRACDRGDLAHCITLLYTRLEAGAEPCLERLYRDDPARLEIYRRLMQQAYAGPASRDAPLAARDLRSLWHHGGAGPRADAPESAALRLNPAATGTRSA